MRRSTYRWAVAGMAALAPLAVSVMISAPANAAECGAGTVYDAPTNTCVVAPLPAAPAPPPPPPPAPPPWNGDPTPGFSIGICAPIPFVALCTGI
ncbi:hypothetical protein CYL16_22970 [Mycobacterium sp. EPG1]|nr:hypothetical protein CYL16_22970 [Mycobacterium sp. EPG1]